MRKSKGHDGAASSRSVTARTWFLALVALVSGCVGAAPSGVVDDAPGPAPVEVVPPTFLEPIDIGAAGRSAEAIIAAGPEGRVYVAARGQFWRSLDHGATFERLGKPGCYDDPVAGTCPPGREYVDAGLDGFDGDGDLALDEAGRLYFVGLNGEGGTVPFISSGDEGETWSTPFYLAGRNASDRQWLHASPNGTLYVTWRDRGDPDQEDAPSFIAFRRSPDGGKSWGPTVRVFDDVLQGPIVQDARTSALYVPLYDGGLGVARSLDEGATWTVHQATRAGELSLDNGKPTNVFPIAAVDDAGAVYLVWSEDVQSTAPAGTRALAAEVKLAVSTDGGSSWSEPRTLSTPGRLAILPWMVAGRPGHIAVSWYEAEMPLPAEDLANVWHVQLAQSATAHEPDATFVVGRVNREPAHVGTICAEGGGCDDVCVALTACIPTRICESFACAGRDRSRTELFEMTLRNDGHPLLVWVGDPQPGSVDSAVRVIVGGVAEGTPLR